MRILAGIIRVEAWLRRRQAWGSGNEVHAGLFDSLGRMVGDFARLRQRRRATTAACGATPGRNGVRLSLSIVIPSHNRPDLLRLCLASVQRHAPTDTEIIIVDDASPDHAVSRTVHESVGSASRRSSFFQTGETPIPPITSVRVLRLPRQRGFCAAVNAGIRAAHNPIVELLNDDTEVSAGWADSALKHFADPQVAAVAPLVLRGSPDRRATAHR